MRILSWNILSGGGGRIPGILSSLQRHQPEVIVLTEYWKNVAMEQALCNMGWEHLAHSDVTTEPSQPNNKESGILIASKVKIEEVPSDPEGPAERSRWKEVWIPEWELGLTGLHIPDHKSAEPHRKDDFWTGVIRLAKARHEHRHILIGDFNTGYNDIDKDLRGTNFHGWKFLDDLKSLGWVDIWRDYHLATREYTWYSNTQNGFRLDHAFVSQALKAQFKAEYHHHEREMKLSDHSILLVDPQTV